MAQQWRPVGADAATGVDDAPSIVFVQHTLARLGYDPGVVDGKFGPRTRGAIKAYQTANGLTASGELSRELLMRLKDDATHTG